jgi:hypothetical protein
VQADALAFVLKRRWPDFAQHDPDVITARLDTLRITLSHLLVKETFFTFLGPH